MVNRTVALIIRKTCQLWWFNWLNYGTEILLLAAHRGWLPSALAPIREIKKGFFVNSKEKERREKLKNIWKRKCCNVEGDGGVSTKNKKHRSPQLQPSRQTSNRVTRAGQSCGWNKSHRAVGAGRGRPIFDVNCTFAAGRSIYLISSFYLNIFPSFIII